MVGGTVGGTRRWWRWLVLALAVVVCVVAGGTISWMWLVTRVLGRVPAVIDSSGRAEIAGTWESMPTDLEDFHRALVADPAFQARTREPLGDAAAIAACQALPIEARFAWTSDVQIRQREAKLYGRGLSSKLDRFIDSFERNEQQEEYDWAVYLSIVAAVNQLNVRYQRGHDALIRFAIHTGDAMDAGFIQELYQFIAITNLLNVPWFNVVGNHDSAVFGNYLDDMSWTARASSDFYPAASLPTFLAMHDSSPPRLLRFHGASPVPPNASSEETVNGDIDLVERDPDTGMPKALRVTPPSKCHGFDLAGKDRRPGRCAEQPGYYWFPLLGTRVVIVVLQSSRLHQWGEWTGWDNDPDQLAWLEREIVSNPEMANRTLLFFMHHRVDEANAALRRLFDRAAAHNAIAVFTGHTHVDDLTAYPGFHDINLGSIISFPQMARVIELHRASGERRGCLLSRPLWTTSWEDAMRLASPSRAALDGELAICERDRALLRDTPDKRSLDGCDGDASERCVGVRSRIARMVERAATCGHLGAIADHVRRRGKMPVLEETLTSFVIRFDIPQEGQP